MKHAAEVPQGRTRFGESGPRVILSHCSLGHSGAWKPLVAALPPVEAIGLDLPGHGGSGVDPSRSLQRQGADAVLAELADGPAHLIGHSFGARVVLRAALDRPDRVLSLTLIEPMMFHLLDDADDPLFAEEEAASLPWVAAVQSGDLDGAAAAFTALWGDGTPWAQVPERQRAYLRDRLGFVGGAGPDVMGHPPGQITLEDIAGLSVPLTLLSGAETRAGATAICHLISRGTGAQHHVIPGAGHMLPITHPEPVAVYLAKVLV
ncbi:MAG: alpha/beta hydrolase [Pseudomonadota bacterium]